MMVSSYQYIDSHQNDGVASIPFYLYDGYLYNWRDDFLKNGLGFIIKFVWRVIADKRYNLQITLVCVYACVLTGTCRGEMQNDIFTLPCSKYSEKKWVNCRIAYVRYSNVLCLQ